MPYAAYSENLIKKFMIINRLSAYSHSIHIHQKLELFTSEFRVFKKQVMNAMNLSQNGPEVFIEN